MKLNLIFIIAGVVVLFILFFTLRNRKRRQMRWPLEDHPEIGDIDTLPGMDDELRTQNQFQFSVANDDQSEQFNPSRSSSGCDDPVQEALLENNDQLETPDLFDEDELDELEKIKDEEEILSLKDTRKKSFDKENPPRPIVIYVMAKKNRQFVGYELLQALSSSGVCFGDMNIFHRHEKMNGEGKVLFSLASATEPGTFDMQDMGALSCTGLTLFSQLNGDLTDMDNFDLMLSAATQLEEDLDGILLDEYRKPLSESAIKSYRQHIRDNVFEENEVI